MNKLLKLIDLFYTLCKKASESIKVEDFMPSAIVKYPLYISCHPAANFLAAISYVLYNQPSFDNCTLINFSAFTAASAIACLSVKANTIPAPTPAASNTSANQDKAQTAEV